MESYNFPPFPEEF